MIHKMNLPKRLKQKLETDDKWISNVKNVFMNVESLYSSTPYFFPEYTDHGILHINHTLDIMDKLITEESIQKILEKELAICVISLMLHDIGMFISYSGFLELLEKKIYVDLDKTKTFKQCWEEYIFHIKHFSRKQLMNKFGITEVNISDMILSDNLNETTKLIIGEFLRQNHHIVSYHIILNQIITDIDFLKNTNIDPEEREIIGLIARSHGMNIRDTEGYLKRKFYCLSKPKNISIFYLMVLVRLADCLDVGVERADHVIKTFYVRHSYNSKQEFLWNQCIKYEDFEWNEEKEYLSIDCSPMSATQFINIKKWLSAVQYELDICWAIIGEHYSMQNYKMSVRRINSNIIKEEVVNEYEKRFHTKEAYLDANADILKLLIEPLYGNEPSFGVREILQNAIDACRERAKKEKERSISYQGKVHISLDLKEKEISFVDNGIGMDISVIKDYYLIAGASYRRSDIWSKEYKDADGKVRVLRNGKFGIGVLATFLLGENATVITRNINDEMGWKFDIQLEQNNIDIKRVSADVGTKIEIKLSEEVIGKLTKKETWSSQKWYEWYIGEDPVVTYDIDQEPVISYASMKKPKYLLNQNEYKSIYWTYYRYRSWSSEVCCNGIIIPRMPMFPTAEEYRFAISTPNLFIEDWDGKVPVNLARSELLTIPCMRELYTECCKCFLAQFLMHNLKFATKFTMMERWNASGRDIIYAKEGYTLCDAAFIGWADIRKIKLIAYRNVGEKNLMLLDAKTPIIFLELTRKGVTKNLFENIISNNYLVNNIQTKFNYMYINKESYQYVSDIMKKNRWGHLEVKEVDNNIFISDGVKYDMKENLINNKNILLYAEMDVKIFNVLQSDIMLEVIRQYIPQRRFIPYRLEDRKKILSKAFDELEMYMKK